MLAQDRAERQRAREVKTGEYVKRKREAKECGARYRWEEGTGRVWQWDRMEAWQEQAGSRARFVGTTGQESSGSSVASSRPQGHE